MLPVQVIRAETYQKMSRQAANILSAQVILNPRSVLGLATGSTPLGLYRQLIEWSRRGDVDFSQAVTVNLDEYVGLGPASPQSYHYFMWHHFFDHIVIRPENVHLPNGLAPDLQAECAAYDALIARLGGIDLQLLGIGHNGHIGFNEPGQSFDKTTHVVELKPSTRAANARFFPSPDAVPKQAITLGLQSILAARKVLLVASGRSKKEILERALTGPVTPQIPASLLQLHPDLTVVCSVESDE